MKRNANAQNIIAQASDYREPQTFWEMTEREKLWELKTYLSTLLDLEKSGIEAKREINSVMTAINKIMGL